MLLHSVEVRRELQMNTLAVRLLLKVPIVWMTGYYSLKNAKVFHFIPAGGDGNFNVDLKYVSIEVVATMKSTNELLNLLRTPHQNNNLSSTSMNPLLTSPYNFSTNLQNPKYNDTLKSRFNDNNENKRLVCLGVFEMGVHWRKASFKFDGLWKGFNHLTDFSLNQVNRKTEFVNMLA